LAALAGLGYALTSQSRNKVDLNQSTSSGDSNPTRGAGYNSTENRLESPEDTIKRSMKKAPLDGTEMYPSGVMGGARMADNVNPSVVNAPVASAANVKGNDLPKAIARNRSPGDEMSAYAKNPPNSVSSTEAGMKNYKPRRNTGSPANSVSSTEAGMENYKPRRSQLQAQFKDGQPGYDEAGRFVGSQRGYDEAGNPMKPGGAVKKMASGGMASSASSRADGIASKGKTRGKIC